MPKMVEKEAVLKIISFDTEAYTAVNMLSSVEITKCKDCQFFTKVDYPFGICQVWDDCSYPEDFCSYAERKTDGN